MKFPWGSYPTDDMGHTWRRDEDGDIDMFGEDYGFHNGPVCVVCGYGYCHHCQDNPTQACTQGGYAE